MRSRSNACPGSLSTLSKSSELALNARLSNKSMGTCPAGSQWYACPIQYPTFFGCCASNTCNGVGCPSTDLRAAGMGTAAGPNKTSNDGSYWPNVKCSVGKWCTCSDQNPSFQGCCDNNPCNGDGSGCPAGQLHPAEFLNGTTTATTSSLPVSTNLTLLSSLYGSTLSSTGYLAQAPQPSPSPITISNPQSNSNLLIVTPSSTSVSLTPDSTVTVTRLSTVHSTVTTYPQTSSPSPEPTSQTPSSVTSSQSASTSTAPLPSSQISSSTDPTTLLTISTSPTQLVPSSTSSSSSPSAKNPTTLFKISTSSSLTLNPSSDSLTKTPLAKPTESGLTNALSSSPPDPNRRVKIIGGTVGGVLLLFLILLAAWCSRRRYRKMADERRARLSAQQSVAEGDFAVPYSNLPVSNTPPQLTQEPPYPMSSLQNQLYPVVESAPESAPRLRDPFPPHVGYFLSQPAQDEDHSGDPSNTTGIYGGDDSPSLWNRNRERPSRSWDFNREGNAAG